MTSTKNTSKWIVVLLCTLFAWSGNGRAEFFILSRPEQQRGMPTIDNNFFADRTEQKGVRGNRHSASDPSSSEQRDDSVGPCGEKGCGHAYVSHAISEGKP